MVTTAHRHPCANISWTRRNPLGIPRNPDFNGAVQEGCGYFQATVRDGRRCGAKEAFIDRRHRPNLTLLRDALCSGWSSNGLGRAASTTWRRGRVERAEADGEVICAAGAIGSPHLMMLSGLGPAAHLAEHGIGVVADLPGVGQDLQDHMGGCPVSATLRHPERFGTPVRDFAAAVEEFEATGSGLLATHYLDTGAFLRLDPADPDPDFEALFVPGVAEFYRTDGAPECTRFHLGGFLLRPRSRGTVTLASGNPLDRPLIDPNYYAERHDLALAVKSARRRMEILDAKPFEDVRFGQAQPGAVSDADLETLIRRNTSTTWHPTSTCRMGTDDRAVVDPDLRVRGIERLRICDASVMPTMTSGNTNAPVVMIAEKGADLILASAAI